MSLADVFSGLGVALLLGLGRGILYLVKAAQRQAQGHEDILDICSSLADEQGDEKWRLHRIESRLNIAEPPPRRDTRQLIDDIRARAR